MTEDDRLAATTGWLDHLFNGFAFRNRPLTPDERARLAERFAQVAAFYRDPAHRERLFAPAPLPQTRGGPVGRLRGGAVIDLSWRSTYAPVHPDHRALCRAHPRNATVHARWYRHEAPAPVVALVHGWGMGVFPVDQLAFRAGWLYRQGLDALMIQLPFHALRAPPDRLFPPMFPSFRDPVRTVEGFAQAIADLRAGIQLARGVHGAPVAGAFGMSLGGFATALLATVEPALDFAVCGIPFASFADLVYEGTAELDADTVVDRLGVSREAFRAPFAAIDPCARPPAVDPRAVVVVCGAYDRVTPSDHGRRLHAHFEGSRLVTFPGGHLLQLGREPMFEAVVAGARAALARHGSP